MNCYFPCLLIHFLQACIASTTPPNITTDQSALLSLKPLITSDPLAKNWSVAFPVCQWTGVTCGARRQRVTSLNISNMGFTGMIPPTLGNLSFLVSLDLSGNDFDGQLPHELAHLRRLRFLNLGINDFSGEIPSWFGYSFPKLQYLNLANNSFLGSIPPSIFSNISTLEQLQLSFNNLEGTIPKEIGKLHNLKKLICERNQLSGSLPSEIFNVSSLEIIALRANHLSGSLPSDMCRRLQKLFWLNLSENKFNGEILSTLSQCSALQSLSLSYNNFTGIIPNEIGNLTELQLLYLGSNNLDGTLLFLASREGIGVVCSLQKQFHGVVCSRLWLNDIALI
ncbi:LRR receptor-like serine/threonine-protein kinase GSO2 [Coffea eugenioides]|uniref:LRR receptor-like serine/threonine-protein kinase GSO2 n=1 Tax=Coffea eugenioides TaxID=49369 RepID=UPI000F612CB1|nr:LRR receptor-like serine/threonine-protein kinase GSO2 [Coffea eugenioides]